MQRSYCLRREHQEPNSSTHLEEGQPVPPAHLPSLGCTAKRFVLAVAAVTALHLLAALGPALYRFSQNTFRVVHYQLDPTLFGRNNMQFPAPHCCIGTACLQPRTGRVAVVTYLRSEDYLPLLQQLDCSMTKSNPALELAVMTVPGELPPGGKADRWLSTRNLTRIEVAPLSYPNYHTPRYAHNWLKLRVLGLTQYDAVLLLDCDLVVVGDLTPLFGLPVDFAASWDQSRWLGRSSTRLAGGINGGVLLLRPCLAVGRHMRQLLADNPKLRFSYGAAEQDFLSWYYRYTGFMLPVDYNTMASDSLDGNLTVGGRPPVVVHFTQHKPFAGPVHGMPGHQFLCSAEELQH